MRRLDLTHAARADLADIVDRSARDFGDQARRRYEVLLEIALSDLQADPVRLGGVERPELGEGTRTYHLRHCRARAKLKGAVVNRPRHVIAFAHDDERVLILRVLHDSMEISAHLPSEPLGDES